MPVMADSSNSSTMLPAGREWKVHKFGGTSVADAKCFQSVAQIIEDDLLGKSKNNQDHHESVSSSNANSNAAHVAVVVSAMGGKPKTTDLLLSTVSNAAQRDDAAVQATIQRILDKHAACLQILFREEPSEEQRLLKIVQKDLDDIQDILKTVALMKWQAERISELVSGYGEVWSTQILAALLQWRSQKRTAAAAGDLAATGVQSLSMDDDEPDVKDSNAVTPTKDHTIVHHEFYYVDARRVIIVDEEAVQHGSVCWDISRAKLADVLVEAQNKKARPDTLVHVVMTGFVASNTHGVATTLQRDGSDYSAAILGKLLSATQINIWTDVDGCLSADPRRVPGAYVIPDVSYNEAMELSYFGAKVIHPKTMQPAISANPQIPIYIRNTFNPQFRGTRIFITSTTQSLDSDKCVCGFSSIEAMALVNVEGTGMSE